MPNRIWLFLAIMKLQHAPAAVSQVSGIAGKKAASMMAHRAMNGRVAASSKTKTIVKVKLIGLPNRLSQSPALRPPLDIAAADIVKPSRTNDWSGERKRDGTGMSGTVRGRSGG